MADQRIRQLKIKTGVVKRLTKEKGYYEKERDGEWERHAKMKAKGADEYELRKQMEVIQESQAMIPDTNNRLLVAKNDLQNMLDGEKDMEATEEYKEAGKMIEEAIKVLE